MFEQLGSQILVIVGGALFVAAAALLLPIGWQALGIGKQAADKVRQLDKEGASTGDIAKAGSRSLVALGFLVGIFSLVLVLLIVPLMEGVPIQETPLALVFRFLWNATFGQLDLGTL